MAVSISVRLTLYRRASALRLGSRQPGSRCTSAAAIRSASTVIWTRASPVRPRPASGGKEKVAPFPHPTTMCLPLNSAREADGKDPLAHAH
jgi:hypothetical protein